MHGSCSRSLSITRKKPDSPDLNPIRSRQHHLGGAGFCPGPWPPFWLSLLRAAMWTVAGRESQVIAATVAPTEGTDIHLNPASPGPAAVSPDGLSIAYSARDADGEVLLYVRRIDAPQAQAFSDTQNAAYPFWSPDSRWIGFFNRADGTMKKIDTRGGPPITLCRAPNGKGGTWNDDGVIVLRPTPRAP